VTPAVIPITVAMPAPTKTAGAAGVATPNAIALVTVIPSPTLQYGYVVNPAAINLAITIGAVLATGRQPDAEPITVTVRDTGHTVTVRVHQRGATVVTPGYVTFPGTAGNYLRVPDSDALDITADITMIARVRLTDWTPTGSGTFISKRANNTVGAYRFDITPTGFLRVITTPNGTDTLQVAIQANAITPAANGEWKWVAVTLDVDNGAAGKTARFWRSDDGITWTKIGTDITSVGTTSIFPSTSFVEIGSTTTATQNFVVGDISHISIRDGIGTAGVPGGLEVFRFDGNDLIAGPYTGSTLTAHTGQTITVLRSGSPSTTVTQLAIAGPTVRTTVDAATVRTTVRGDH
jgi:hypothetical protein